MPETTSDSSPARAICGLWIDPAGAAHLSIANASGSRRELVEPFSPFCWADADAAAQPLPDGVTVEVLNGPGRWNRLLRFPDVPSFRSFVNAPERTAFPVDWLRSLESQFLISRGETLFAGMRFGDLRRCQCDIETACSVPGGFSHPRRAEDRVLAIGLRFGESEELLTIGETTDDGERRLLEKFSEALVREDPDTIEGHNIFRFDLEYLRRRCQRLGLSCSWGRFGQEARVRSGRLRVAERWIDYPRCDIPGRMVFDTYLMIQLYDLTGREMVSYGLKEVALHLGISGEESGNERTYIDGRDIQSVFHEDRSRFLAYLSDDLRETRGIADLLLPTYFAQASAFPMTMQEAALRGSSSKVDLLMLQEYYRAGEALPEGVEVQGFEGAFAHSFERGVFKKVWHFDVASLYPSLLLNFNRNPVNDSLGAFIPLLKKLREYRLRYKNLARAAEAEEIRAEYEARQSSYKILINSFYGYLGFSGARFADGELAAAVTRGGRELLQELIRRFQKLGCRILEADTDGIYLTAPDRYSDPVPLLKEVTRGLPEGIELEFDGEYEAMFCYKAKNYALYTGKKIILRGSALRSRGMEPYLRDLTEYLIRWLLGLEKQPPKERVEEVRDRILRQEVSVEELARSENIGQNPEAYREAVEADSGKARRPALEAALKVKPVPRAGDRVTYYIAQSRTGGSRDWERATPISAYDPQDTPYDVGLYLRKLDDWVKRYEDYVCPPKERFVQGELF